MIGPPGAGKTIFAMHNHALFTSFTTIQEPTKIPSVVNKIVREDFTKIPKFHLKPSSYLLLYSHGRGQYLPDVQDHRLTEAIQYRSLDRKS